jgi:prophage tail gpP-like protein
MSSEVSIRVRPVGGGAWADLAWRSVKIRKSLDEICHSLEMELPAGERGKIHKHDRVEVRYYSRYLSDTEGNEKKRLVTTVLVDEVTGFAGTGVQKITVLGRSPARDLIDSAWSGGVNPKEVPEGRLTLKNAVKYIAGRFTIGVTRFPDGGPDLDYVTSFSWESESPWTKLLEEAGNHGYALTSNEGGNLYLWKIAAGTRYERDAAGGVLFSLREGRNVRSVEYTENGAEQFHEYVVKGIGEEFTETDDTCKTNRILTVNLTGDVTGEALRRRALTEKNRRRENRALVTVSGWGLDDEQLQSLGDTYHKEIFWNPNFLIPVTIPSIGVDATLLVSQVEYEADPAAMSCALTLVNKEAYL